MISPRRLSRSYFAGALFVRTHDVGGPSGIGIQRQVAPSFPRFLCEIVRLWAWSATMRAAKITEPRSPVATQVVLRLNLLITLYMPAKGTGCSGVCNRGSCNSIDSPQPSFSFNVQIMVHAKAHAQFTMKSRIFEPRYRVVP